MLAENKNLQKVTKSLNIIEKSNKAVANSRINKDRSLEINPKFLETFDKKEKEGNKDQSRLENLADKEYKDNRGSNPIKSKKNVLSPTKVNLLQKYNLL